MRKLTQKEELNAISEIETLGYTVIKGFLNKEEIKYSRDLIEKAPKHEAPNKTANIVFGLVTLNKWFLDMADQESLSKILMYFINDQYFGKIPDIMPNYIIAYSVARTSTEALPIHIDSYVPNPGKFPLLIQSLIALEAQTVENGNTYLVPHSHTFGEYPDQNIDHPSIIDLFPEAGDMVVWDSRIWHGSRKNISGRTRWAIINTYSRWWIKPRLDSTQFINELFYNEISDRQRALLGFCSIPPSDPNERISTRIGFEDLPKEL